PWRLTGSVNDPPAHDRDVVARRLSGAGAADGNGRENGRHDEHRSHTALTVAGFVIRLTSDPTTTTAITPMGLCQRNEIPRVDGCVATAATTAIPATSPTNAPVPVARLNPSASTNTPSSDP